MKKIIFLILVLAFITSCSNDTELANPAATYCVDQGGELVNVERDGGMDADCVLEDGTTCPQWDYFNGVCGYSFEDSTDNVNLKYENGILNYEVEVQKPTPCYSITKDELILESYPIQVVINLGMESSGDICTQVITPETITGEMNLESKPSSITINLNGEEIYSNSFK